MKRLSEKQKDFAKNFVDNGGNGTQAVVDAYNVKNRDSARSYAPRLLKNPSVKAEIEMLLDKHEMTDDYAMTVLKEGLEAKVVTNYKGEAKETDIPDHDTRHKYFQDLAKFKDMYPADKNLNMNLNLDAQLEGLSKAEIINLLKETIKDVQREDKRYEQGEEQGEDESN